jgi:hypothetical protein
MWAEIHAAVALRPGVAAAAAGASGLPSDEDSGRRNGEVALRCAAKDSAGQPKAALRKGATGISAMMIASRRVRFGFHFCSKISPEMVVVTGKSEGCVALRREQCGYCGYLQLQGFYA